MTVGRRIAAVFVIVALGLGVAPIADASTDKTKVYIDSVFELFLGRPATGAEVDSWRSTVAAGSRDILTNALATSDEWAGSEVNNLYLKILRRPADANGRAYWVQTIKDGNRLEDIAAYFYGGAEYYKRVGSTSTKFIDNLYLDLLGRPADDDGRNYWRSRIVAGMTRSEVAANLYISIESRRSRVRSVYRTILNRLPDSSGEAYWAEQLKTIGDVKLAAFLAASQEYYNRSTMPAPTSSTTSSTTSTTTTTTKPTTTTTTTTTSTTTIARIMPLGDSNTVGHTNYVGGYRIQLEDKLQLASYPHNFVGSRSAGPLDDPDHEGISGNTINDVQARVNDALNIYKPTVVLLMVGTNDIKIIGGSSDITKQVNELGELITQIRSVRPSARIIVANLPPMRSDDGNTRVVDFNNKLSAKLDSLSVPAGDRVDAYGSIVRSNMFDELHPCGGEGCTGGYDALSQVWFAALT